MKQLRIFALVSLFLVVLTVQSSTVAKASVKVDFNGTASNVIDGDTFDLTAVNGTQYRIRLADIDAPERDEEGYTTAREYLNGLVFGKTVLLDVDDTYVWDDYGSGTRLVAVAYVNHNSTHLLNVNQALVQGANVEKKNYDNEFSPYAWTLYLPKEQAVPEFPGTTILVLVAVALLVVAVFVKRNLFRDR